MSKSSKEPSQYDVIAALSQQVVQVNEKLEAVLTGTMKQLEPVQRTAFTRFPTVFTLLVTFGVTATFFGVERILEEVAYLNDRPWLILALGIGVLVITGRLYKKLG